MQSKKGDTPLILAAFIFVRWVSEGAKQVDLIIGRAADPSFLATLREIAETHDPSMALDTVRAYHFGPRYLVEVEVVMDERTVLRESHDCGILLQHKIEMLPQVERGFVHIDYKARDDDDHDHTTPVARKMHHKHELSHSEEIAEGLPLTATSLTSLLEFDSDVD